MNVFRFISVTYSLWHQEQLHKQMELRSVPEGFYPGKVNLLDKKY